MQTVFNNIEFLTSTKTNNTITTVITCINRY